MTEFTGYTVRRDLPTGDQRTTTILADLVLRFPWGSEWEGTHAGVLTDESGPYTVVGYLPGNPVFSLIIAAENLALADPNRMGERLS